MKSLREYIVQESLQIPKGYFAIQLTKYTQHYEETEDIKNLFQFVTRITKEKIGPNVHEFVSNTEIKRNNFKQIKWFKSEEVAKQFAEQHKEAFNHYEYEIVPSEDVKNMLTELDPNKKSADMKKAQEEAVKQRRKEKYEANKEANKKKEQEYAKEDPGNYYVFFPEYGNPFAGFTITLKAKSINDAFEKGKYAALKEDPNCNTQGYDRRIMFTKSHIKKEK